MTRPASKPDTPRPGLGELEQLVLLTLLRLGEEAYGVSVRRELELKTGQSVALGAIYAALERLEQKGLVASHRGEPTAERGGRAKRHFRVEPAGVRALERCLTAVETLRQGLRLGPEVS